MTNSNENGATPEMPDPIVTLIVNDIDEDIAVYLNDTYVTGGECEIDLGYLLDALDIHVHYLQTQEKAYPYDGKWTASLSDALRLPVLETNADGWMTREHPTDTLASINGIVL